MSTPSPCGDSRRPEPGTHRTPDGYRRTDLAAAVKARGFDVAVSAYPVHPSRRRSPTTSTCRREGRCRADRAITQMFFDNELFLRHRQRIAPVRARHPQARCVPDPPFPGRGVLPNGAGDHPGRWRSASSGLDDDRDGSMRSRPNWRPSKSPNLPSSASSTSTLHPQPNLRRGRRAARAVDRVRGSASAAAEIRTRGGRSDPSCFDGASGANCRRCAFRKPMCAATIPITSPGRWPATTTLAGSRTPTSSSTCTAVTRCRRRHHDQHVLVDGRGQRDYGLADPQLIHETTVAGRLARRRRRRRSRRVYVGWRRDRAHQRHRRCRRRWRIPGSADDVPHLAEAYRQQIAGLVEGVDVLLIETVFDTLNAKVAFAAPPCRRHRVGDSTDGVGHDHRPLGSHAVGRRSAPWQSVRHADPLTIVHCGLAAPRCGLCGGACVAGRRAPCAPTRTPAFRTLRLLRRDAR